MSKCIIVDDEPLAIKVIKRHLNYFEDIEVVAECANAMEAVSALRKQKIDLVFLDIEMPKISGFEFLSSLESPPKIIIVTAYRNYALEGYDHDIIDYLLKPVSFERFYKAISKFYNQKTNNDFALLKESGTERNDDLFIYVPENKTIHKLYLKNVIFIESYREYIRIHTPEKSVMTKMPIGSIEEKLKDKGFVRIHKSFIVSISKISSISPNSISLADKELPIGRTYKKNVMEKLNFNMNLL